MNKNNFIFTPENVSKYWNLLNNSNNPDDKKIANQYLMQLKEECSQLLEISIELFKSKSLYTYFITLLNFRFLSYIS